MMLRLAIGIGGLALTILYAAILGLGAHNHG